MTKYNIKLIPLNRLTESFDIDLNLDRDGIFGNVTYEQYIKQHQQSQNKLDQLIKSIVITDASLFLVVNGQNWDIPGLGIKIQSIPAILEILLFLSSLTFFFLCFNFVTKQCYSAIIDQFGINSVKNSGIDPDFFNASRNYFEFPIKLYRRKLNLWGDDIYNPGKAFSIFCTIVNFITYLSISVIPITHFVLAYYASCQVAQGAASVYEKVFLISLVTLLNFGGLILISGMIINFSFSEDDMGQIPDKKDHNS